MHLKVRDEAFMSSGRPFTGVLCVLKLVSLSMFDQLHSLNIQTLNDFRLATTSPTTCYRTSIIGFIHGHRFEITISRMLLIYYVLQFTPVHVSAHT